MFSTFTGTLRRLWFPAALALCATVVTVVCNSITKNRIDALFDNPRSLATAHVERLHTTLQDTIRSFDEELDALLSSPAVSVELAQSLADERSLFRWMSDHDAALIEKEIGLLVVDSTGVIRAWCGWLRGVEDSLTLNLSPDETSSAIVWTSVCAFLRRSKPIDVPGQPAGSVRRSWVVALAPLCSLLDDLYGLRPERPLRVRKLFPGGQIKLAPFVLVGLNEYARRSRIEEAQLEKGQDTFSENRPDSSPGTRLQADGWRLRAAHWMAYQRAGNEDADFRLRALLGIDNKPIGGTRFTVPLREQDAEYIRREGEKTRNTMLVILCLVAVGWFLRLLIPGRGSDKFSRSVMSEGNVEKSGGPSGSVSADTASGQSPGPGGRHLFLRAAAAVCVLLCTRAAFSAADFPGSLIGYFPIRLRPGETYPPPLRRSVWDLVANWNSVEELLVTALFLLAASAVVAHFIRLVAERRARSGARLKTGSVLILAAVFALVFGAGTSGIEWLVRLLLERSTLEFFSREGGYAVSPAVLLATLALFMMASALVIVLGYIAWFGTACANRQYVLAVCGIIGALLVSFSAHGAAGFEPGWIGYALHLTALLFVVLSPFFVPRSAIPLSGNDPTSSPEGWPLKKRLSSGMVSLCAACLVFPGLYFGEESHRSRMLADKVVQLGGRLEKRLDEFVSEQLEEIASDEGLRIALENVQPERTGELACGAMEVWLGTSVFSEERSLAVAGLADAGVESYVGIRCRDGRLISEFSTGVPPIGLWWRGAQRDETTEDSTTPEQEKPDSSALFGSLEMEPEWRTWNVLCNYAGRELRVHAGAALVTAWSDKGERKGKYVGQVILAVVSPYQPIRTSIAMCPIWPWSVPRPGERQQNEYSIAEFFGPASPAVAVGEMAKRTDDPRVFSSISVPPAVVKRIEAGEPSVRDVQEVGGTPYEVYFGVRKVHDTPAGYLALARPLPDRWDVIACFLALVLVFVCAGVVTLYSGSLVAGVLLLPKFRDVFAWRPFGVEKWGIAKKLVVAVAVSSFVPMLILAMFTARLMAERAQADKKDRILRNAEIGRAIFKRLYPGELPRGAGSLPVAVAARDAVEETSATVGEHIDIYEGGRIVLSSREEVFAAGLASRFLSPALYYSLVLQNGQQAVDDREVPTAAVALDPGRPGGKTESPVLLAISAVPEKFAALGIQSRTVGVMLGTYVLLILVAWWIGGMAAKRISQPLDQLVEATERISRGDLEFKIGRPGSGDVGRLVIAFDRMMTDLRLSRLELARAAREATWREIARQVAHEVKNPLTPIKLSAQHLIRAYEDGAPEFEKILKDCTRTIVAEVELLERIATSFSNIAKLPECKLGDFAVNEIVDEALSVFSSSFAEREISVEKRLEESLPQVKVDRDWIKRVLVNLLKNALEAMPERGKLVVSTWRSGAGVKIAIVDNGSGIPADVLPRIFEPYFSTKEQGTGLGLAICKRILDDLGGKIEITSEVGRGTRAEVWLRGCGEA